MHEKQLPDGCLTGTFLSECKNRFRCLVDINGTVTPCYIASSCRLDNFVDLTGKKVLLKPTDGRHSVAAYTLWGVDYKRSYIMLNSSLANRAINNSITSRKFSFIGARKDRQREYSIEGYKADFYFPGTKTIIEVKSIISIEEAARLGAIHSDRFLRQLDAIEKLLQKGYKAHLFVVSLNPYVRNIEIPSDDSLGKAIEHCKKEGLEISAFTCRIANDGEVYIHQHIPIS